MLANTGAELGATWSLFSGRRHRSLRARTSYAWPMVFGRGPAGAVAAMTLAMTEDSLPYVVVLAGGEGRRLASLTRVLYGALERYAVELSSDGTSDALDAAYRNMKPANFSHDVLAYSRSLAVIPVSGSGWSDWGSPARVFASLAGNEGHDRLVDRITGELEL